MPISEAQLAAHERRRADIMQDLLLRKREREHAEASFVASLERYVAQALELLQVQMELAELVAAAPADIRARKAPAVAQEYAVWLNDARPALDDIIALSRRGISIPRTDEFRQAVRRVRVLVENGDRIVRADEQIAGGKGVAMEEAFNELRRHPGA